MGNYREELKTYLSKELGIKAKRLEHYELAFAHRSLVHEQNLGTHESNERLEFLGDSVLGLALVEHLYQTNPTMDEGDLSKMKAQLGSRQTLAGVAQRLDLGRFLRMGRGESHQGSHNLPSLVSNTFEAVVGALFLDQGFPEASKFVVRNLQPELGKDLVAQDFKSTLQEFAQRKFRTSPHYQVVRAYGPEHHKTFEIVMKLNGKVYGRGRGHTKKDAEQDAARHTLKRFGHQPDPARPLPAQPAAAAEPSREEAPRKRRGWFSFFLRRGAEE
ncbi:MAG: ribonuclease III [bacterium]